MFIYLTLLETEQEKDRFTILYNHYRYTMLHCAMGVVHDPALAEDVVHTAFLKVIEILDKFEEPESSKSKNLIVTIVKHKAIDVLRCEKRIELVPPEELDENYYSEGPQPDDAVLSRLSCEEMLACFMRLQEHYRIILGLRYYQQFSSAEIAKVLDITRKNADIRLYRAKKRLYELLCEEGIFSEK